VERSLWTDERIDDMVDRVEKRFDQVDRRFDAVDRRMEARFDRLDAKIDDLRRDMNNQFIVTTSAILALAGVTIAHSL
jgi:hypothetical protein